MSEARRYKGLEKESAEAGGPGMTDRAEVVGDVTGYPRDVVQIIDEWFIKWFHNAPGISDNTGMFNRIRAAVDELKSAMRDR